MKSTTRFFMRAPIAAYRVNAGWLFGTRFLLLEHRGRTSGQIRQAVLEVVETAESGAPVIVSGFGEQSQWCKNITADPNVWVTWGRSRFAAVAARLDPAEGLALFERYRGAHPRAAQVLGGKIGVSLTENLDDAARRLPAFRLEKATT
jgi:deazaflavin-dependent oxidoreductase (nitroreductase family)